jgi:tetratricopeptide (TPR) repeat protein
MELPTPLHDRIKALCANADRLAERGEYAAARAGYAKAFNLLPEPREEWHAAMWATAMIGDTYFHERDFERARDALNDAVRCAGGLGNAFVHLRLGQAYFELADRPRAADNLARAYLAAGRDAFKTQDPKYFALVEEVLRPPPGADRLP